MCSSERVVLCALSSRQVGCCQSPNFAEPRLREDSLETESSACERNCVDAFFMHQTSVRDNALLNISRGRVETVLACSLRSPAPWEPFWGSTRSGCGTPVFRTLLESLVGVDCNASLATSQSISRQGRGASIHVTSSFPPPPALISILLRVDAKLNHAFRRHHRHPWNRT